MTESTFEPERLVAALNTAGVAYVIVGGIAATAHGVVRATRDVDLVPEPGAENLGLLARTLAALGAEHPTGDVSTTFGTRYGDVHVLNRMPAVSSYERLRENAILIELAPDVRAAVCSLADLRSMKLASGRPRDLVDVAELDELNDH